MRTYCNFTESDFFNCEIEKGVYFAVQQNKDMMDERAFQYALHGGKPKDDPYFNDLFRVADIDMSQEKLSDDELSKLRHAHKYLKETYGR